MFYAVLAVVCTFPQAVLVHDGLPLDPADGQPYEDPYLNAWILGWGARAAITQPLQIFDANAFYPRANTLAYSDHMLGYLPLTIPLFWLTGNAILLHNVVLLVSFAASGFGAFLLVRQLVGASGPALIAGIVYAFCPFRFAEYGHVQVLSTQWMPPALWCMHRWRARLRPGHLMPWRPYAGFIVFGGMQSLCSTYFSIYFPLFVGCFAAVAFVLRRERGRLRKATWTLLAPVIWTTLVLPTLLPYVRLRQQMGFKRDLYHNVKYSAAPGSFFSTPLLNRLYGATGLMPPRAEAAGFMGFVTMGLMAGAVVWLVRGRPKAAGPDAAGWGPRRAGEREWAWVYLAAGALMAVLAMGPRIRWGGQAICPGPYMLLYKYVPGFDGLRAPGRLLMLVMLCASVVAGVGQHRLCLAAGRGRRRWRWLALWAPLAVLLVEFAAFPIPLTQVAVGDRIPPVYKWLAEQPPGLRIVEAPLDLGIEDMRRMYYSTYHWDRIVNGKSGFRPPECTAAFLSYAGPTRLLASLMAQMDIDYVIVNEDMMPGITKMYAQEPWCKRVRVFGPVTVFRFHGERVGRPRLKVRAEDLAPVPSSAWRASANVNPELAALVQDGSPETVWQTGENQQGGMQFTMTLDRPRPVRLIRVGFGLHGDEVPWAMSLSASPDGKTWRTVYGPDSFRDMLAWLYWSALENPRNPELDLPLPPGSWRAIRMELLGGGYAGWVMAEVELFETP